MSPEASPSSRRLDERGIAAAGLALSVLTLGLACRELLRYAPSGAHAESLSGGAEHWFFEPSDTSPALVLIVVAWLLWRRRRRLAALWGRPASPAGTAGLWLAGAGVFAWAVRSGAPDLQALALVPLLLGAAQRLGGAAAMRVVAPPLAVLVLAVPLPAPLLNALVWRLQLWTADYTGLFLHALGAAAQVRGDMLFSERGVFVIIESCSGLRSIQTLLLLAVLMVDLFGRRGRHAVALLVAVPFVAFAVNGLRALALIFNPHSDIASIHNLQGIAMLLVGVLVLYAWDGGLARWIPEREGRGGPSPPAHRSPAARARPVPRVAAILGCAGALLALSFSPRFTPSWSATASLDDALGRELAGWPSSPVETDRMFLGDTVFRQMVHRRYESDGEAFDLFVAQASFAIRGSSYLEPKTAFPSSGWLVEREERREIAGHQATLRVIRSGNRRLLSAHWYEGSLGLLAESLRALLALDSGPFHRRRFPLVVRLSTPLEDGSPAARRSVERRLERFAGLFAPTLEMLVRAAPARGQSGSSSQLKPL